MISMILKMSAVTAANVLFSFYLWRFLKTRKIGWGYRILISVIFGGLAVLGTHFGVDFEDMVLNIRDLAPLTAGLFIDPTAGVIAGFIGGIERFIAGKYFGVGSYTTLACSISTCLSGITAAILRCFIFRGKKPSWIFSYFIGSTIEVFHMYVILISHRSDIDMAYYVVRKCAPGMIIFTGIGLAVISLLIKIDAGEWVSPKKINREQDMPVSQKFQFWLFVTSATVLVFNLLLVFALQTQAAVQKSEGQLRDSVKDIGNSYNLSINKESGFGAMSFSVGKNGGFLLYQSDGLIVSGEHMGDRLEDPLINDSRSLQGNIRFQYRLFGRDSMCMTKKMVNGNTLLVYLTSEEVYNERDRTVYETVLADILLFTVIYIMISMLVQTIVVDKLEIVNNSLRKITTGDLDETVEVYSSAEFTSLSNDINQTVTVLKTYIDAAKKKIEEELELAKSIQESALPHIFDFPRNDFEIYATMDPAKEVGGDFYDFFFVGKNKLCMVIADVSGKGIPASLFMMKSKTIIRGFAESGKRPSEVFMYANNVLCDGNDAEMFVTVWIGIIDLETGHMVCSNAGHEFPVIKRKDGDYEYYKQKHNCALAVMNDIPFREYELDLEPGDSLFVYTDGIPEAIDKDENAYGAERLIRTLNRHKDMSQKDILHYLRLDINHFVGKADQFDDVTMIGFKFIGQSEERKNYSGQ